MTHLHSTSCNVQKVIVRCIRRKVGSHSGSKLHLADVMLMLVGKLSLYVNHGNGKIQFLCERKASCFLQLVCFSSVAQIFRVSSGHLLYDV